MLASSTVKKKAESDKFRVLFEHSSDAHFIFDGKGITDCNEATVKLLKCRSKAEVLSIHPGTLSPEFQPDGRRSSEKLKEMDALAWKKGFHRFEWVHKKVDGEEFPVEVTINSAEIDGKPVLVAIWHDLTEIKRAEQALMKLNERMKNELEAAAEFQRSLLPIVTPYSERCKSSWFYKPSEELGGDILNIFRIDEKRIGLYVLDVTGHGVASALLSVTATHFLSGFYKSSCPVDVMEGMNRHFSHESYKNHTFTLVYGIVNLEDGSLVYSSAGHVGPIHLSKDGTVIQHESHGPPIGMFEDSVYSQERISLARGDRLFLISDGIYEARNPADQEFSLEGVYAHLKNQHHKQYSMEYMVNSLARAAYHWCNPGKPDDDISVLGFELR